MLGEAEVADGTFPLGPPQVVDVHVVDGWVSSLRVGFGQQEAAVRLFGEGFVLPAFDLVAVRVPKG